MSRQRKVALAAIAIFLIPGLLLPAFVHQQDEVKRLTYLVYFFVCPIAAWVACLGKPRNPRFYLGVAALLIPIELCCAMAYAAAIQHPTKLQIANIYLPVFFFTTMVMLPVGVALTYMGTRDQL